MDEKEVMAAELFRLKDELRRKEEEPSLNSYDPNGPQALQRKIGKIVLINTNSMLGKIFSRREFEVFFLFFPESRL